MLVGIAGRPVVLHVFDSSRTLTDHWSGLLQAAVLDAQGKSERRTPGALARTFAEQAEAMPLVPAGPAGLSRRFRSAHRVRLDAVRRHDRTAHLSAVDLQEA